MGWLWDHSAGPRRLLRQCRQSLSLARYRLRGKLGQPQAPRIVSDAARSTEGHTPLPHPAICVEGDSRHSQRFLEQQTETSVGFGDQRAAAAFVFTLPEESANLPATFLESLLLVAATEDLSWATGGWAPASAEASGVSGELWLPAGLDMASSTLMRLPSPDQPPVPPVLGRNVPHITAAEKLSSQRPAPSALLPRSAAYLLRDDQQAPRILRRTHRNPAVALGQLPPVEGPPTALLLLPFLAVGGAESLLFDLLQGWTERYRILVVTTEPHRAELGQTVDRCRQLTPHVYTLGEWLPRSALPGALEHLIRRWQVRTLMSWNGTVAFYDCAANLRSRAHRQGHPLRLIDQHFNHRGGWIERLTPQRFAELDASVAVNQPTAEALIREHGAPAEKVRLIHHGVRLPKARSEAEKAAARSQSRELLGLPKDALVVGMFVRLHPQKRPLDFVTLARRMQDTGVWFLLAGGGPLDSAVDRELAQPGIENLIRLSMQDDVEPLYEAVDLCLSTSAFEGLPVFLLDALARAIPVVATAVGDIPLLLRDGGGRLVNTPGDLDGFEAAIQALLDPAERQRQGELGRATVAQRFGLERYRQAYEELLFSPGADS